MKQHIIGIDILRAIAVLSVLIYHIDASFLPGGFTGVDIFFVISGYVVAKSLANRNEHSFKVFIVKFYERRLLRIYPALLVCLTFSSIITILFIPSFYVSRFINDTALSSIFGLSNIVLALNSDTYFSPSAEFNPFVHTWSLGVEEQFYLIFPFLFFIWLKTRSKIISVFAVVSIGLSLVHLLTNENFSYYLITSRFWELAAGVVLYQFHHRKPNNPFFSNTLVVFLGVTLIISGLVFSDKNLFPLPWAILSVMGTCIIIHASVFKNQKDFSPLLKTLSNPFVHIGKISYSLYLWHWPIYSFFRWSIGHETLLEISFSIIITFVFAWLSYYFVEVYFQNKMKVINLKPLSLFAISGSIILVTFFVLDKGFEVQPWRGLSETTNKKIWSPYGGPLIKDNSLPLSSRNIYVVGDSHAGAYEKMLKKLSNETGINLIIFSQGGCGAGNLKFPVLIKDNHCNEKLSGWLKNIKESAEPTDIIFLATLKMYHLVKQNDIYPSEPLEILKNILEEKAERNRELAKAETIKILDSLSKSTELIIMDAPKPVFNYVPFRCTDWWSSSNPICSYGYTESREFMETLRKPTYDSLIEIQKLRPYLSVWDPLPVLCSQKECSAYDKDNPMFFDGDHLSGYGNNILYPSFKKHILELIEKQNRLL